MALGITEPVAEVVSTSNAATYNFGSFTPSTSKLLVVLAMCRGTVDAGAITNVSGTSLTWNKKSSATMNGGADTMYCFWARTPGSTAASVYQVDVTGDNATGCIAYMFELTDAATAVEVSDPIKQIKFNTGSSTNATTGSLSTSLDTLNLYCAAWWGALSSSNPANVSTPPNGSWTEIGDNGFATPTTNGSGAYRAGGETASSLSFTNSSTTWGLVLVEVYGTGNAPPPDPALLVQSQSAVATATTVSATFPGALTSGTSILVAVAADKGGGGAGSNVNDVDYISGTNLTLVDEVVPSGTQNQHLSLWRYDNNTNTTAATVVARSASASETIRIFIMEWSGLDTSDIYDISGDGTGTSQPSASSTGAMAAGDKMVMQIMTNYGSQSSPTTIDSDYTERYNQNDGSSTMPLTVISRIMTGVSGGATETASSDQGSGAAAWTSITAAFNILAAGLKALAGTITTSSTVTGVLTHTNLPTGAIATASTVVGAATVTKAMAGAISVSSVAAGTLSQTNLHTGAIATSSVVTGALSQTNLPTGAVSTSSTIVGAITVAKDVAGAISTSSTVAANLTQTQPVAGAVSTTSTVTGALSQTNLATGAIATSSTVEGDLTVMLAGDVDLAGAISTSSVVVGALTIGKDLAGVVAGTSTVEGALTQAHNLTASVDTYSTLAGLLEITKPLEGIIATTSTVVGALTNTPASVPGYAVSTDVPLYNAIVSDMATAGATVNHVAVGRAVVSDAQAYGATVSDGEVPV